MVAGEWRSAVHNKLEEIAMKLNHLSPQAPSSHRSRSPSPQRTMLEAEKPAEVTCESPLVRSNALHVQLLDGL
jgi:hypothetical protein